MATRYKARITILEDAVIEEFYGPLLLAGLPALHQGYAHAHAARSRLAGIGRSQSWLLGRG